MARRRHKHLALLPGNPAPAATDGGSIGDPPGATLLDRPQSAEFYLPTLVALVRLWRKSRTHEVKR
jgi:hypothetical protein